MADHPHRASVVRRRAEARRPHRGGLATNDVVAQRHVSPAEEAQAWVFERMLRAEIVELLNLPPGEQAEVRSRIEELDRLIRAIRHRFPPKPATPLSLGWRPTADRAPRALLN